MIKRSLSVLAIIMISCILTACGEPQVPLVEEPEVNISGEHGSALYSQDDLETGISIIKEQMDGWDIEYNLQEITYAGDEMAAKGMAYTETLTEGYVYDGCMVFLVDFVSLTKTSAFEKNKLYEDWEWYIIRDEDGKWLFFTNGYISKYMIDENR